MSKKYYRDVITSNKAKCLKCGDVIESKHGHDFVWCSCKALAVDGGHNYLRRCFDDKDLIEEMSVCHQEEREPYDWELERDLAQAHEQKLTEERPAYERDLEQELKEIMNGNVD